MKEDHIINISGPLKVDKYEKFESFSNQVLELIARTLNFFRFLFISKDVFKYKFVCMHKTDPEFSTQFAPHQFFKIYTRIRPECKYHPLQRFENAIRQFDVSEHLAQEMLSVGNSAFYTNVFEEKHHSKMKMNPADLTKLSDISTVTTSADYLFKNMVTYAPNEVERAKIARFLYVRGFSRVIRANDQKDWEKFRNELREMKHLGAGIEDDAYENDVMLFALSYKGKNTEITRRMSFTDDTGNLNKNQGIFVEKRTLSLDFLDDFRWSQVKRSCIRIAKNNNVSGVRIWIDRLVMAGFTDEEKAEFYRIAKWEDLGLFPYAVCPVIRVYENEEENFGTDFWRKLEAVMGVAGHGLIVDDYILHQFDETIHYGPSLYNRVQDGLTVIGGGGIYARAVTLAVATAVLLDGVSVSAANEHMKTRRSITGWKAWAIKTIAIGAYSASHAIMMREEPAFEVRMRDFLVIAFWESHVCRSAHLQGNSYLDTSLERSSDIWTGSSWDGVIEWLGRMPASCNVRDRSEIEEFLGRNAEVKIYTSPTKHVAALISMSLGRRKRTLAVRLSRNTTSIDGHVTGVAEATGLWDGKLKVLPPLLWRRARPDIDQKVVVRNWRLDPSEYPEPRLQFIYKSMKVSFFPVLSDKARLVIMSVAVLVLAILISYIISRMFFLGVGRPILIIIWTASLVSLLIRSTWPWKDDSFIGEQLFDNLLNHGIFDSGIKSKYRKLKSVSYTDLQWT